MLKTCLFKTLTLILLMWRIGWAPNNASRWQMGFNSAFKGLKNRNFIYEVYSTRCKLGLRWRPTKKDIADIQAGQRHETAVPKTLPAVVEALEHMFKTAVENTDIYVQTRPNTKLMYCRSPDTFKSHFLYFACFLYSKMQHYTSFSRFLLLPFV